MQAVRTRVLRRVTVNEQVLTSLVIAMMYPDAHFLSCWPHLFRCSIQDLVDCTLASLSQITEQHSDLQLSDEESEFEDGQLSHPVSNYKKPSHSALPTAKLRLPGGQVDIVYIMFVLNPFYVPILLSLIINISTIFLNVRGIRHPS